MRGEEEIGVEVAVADELPDEREPVRMQTGGRHSDDDVPRLAPRPIDEVGAPDEAHAGPRKIELALAVDAWELGCLAAEDGATGLAADGGCALDEVGDLLEVEAVRRDVVEEEERLGSRGQHVVDAVGRQIAAGVEEPPRAAREHELR